MRPIDADKAVDKLYAFYQGLYGVRRQAVSEAIDIIANMPTITPPPSTPLTLEDLREMDGEPVWINIQGGLWGIAVPAWNEVVFGDRDSARFERLEGLAYRRKPEEGTM